LADWLLAFGFWLLAVGGWLNGPKNEPYGEADRSTEGRLEIVKDKS